MCDTLPTLPCCSTVSAVPLQEQLQQMQRQRESLLQQQQPMFGQMQPMFAPPMTYMPVLGLVRPLVCTSVMLLMR